jgi:hypothetical protein
MGLRIKGGIPALAETTTSRHHGDSQENSIFIFYSMDSFGKGKN